MAAEIQSTQDKYIRADKTNEPPQIKENEVRITTRGRVKKYVDYATRLFQGGNDSEEHKDKQENKGNEDSDGRGPTKQFDTIVLKATGKAINKAVTTAEVVKRTIGDLHQETTLETLEIVDVWEPKEEGLQKVETTRRVASISIKLSRKVDDVNVNAPGYQKPIAQETGFNLGYRGNGRRGGYGRNRGGGGFRGNNRRNQGDRRRNRGNYRGNQGNRQFNRGNYRGNQGPRGPYNNNYGGNRNQGNNYNQMGGGNYRSGPGGPQGRMGPQGGGGGGGGYRQNNFGSPRRYPRNDGYGRRGRGRPRGNYNY